MAKNSKFNRQLLVRLTEELERRLRAEAARRGLSVANLVRDMLEQALSEEAAGLAAREGKEALEKVIKKAIKPEMDRLAKLIYRAGHAAAAAMYLNTQAIADMGKHDAVEMYHMARKKAATYFRVDDQDE
ncbi:Ribbon-helix-helix protein, copG family [Thermanaeromonas toyohensis ToBE]|uniref:Ribbon-helix-helix protein, copG family n=1 Tax=Thermanaeromonas toyohensis ToBE TaxID=698762 RepID=A0A1W1VRM9_9FIRM|nr:ribbon-helix-helix protein, CopG family [Thermanaeromonas toyohensis]SMB95870.1 Ribbon-helix-helix protein, copG family [Thermanaeromonas toyohensis ToBE]